MPLWRISLHVLFFAFAAQRAIGAYVLQVAHVPPIFVAAMVVQALAGVIVSLSMLTGRFLVGSLGLLAATVIATALLSLLVGGGIAAPAAIGQAAVAVLATVGLAYFMRREKHA